MMKLFFSPTSPYVRKCLVVARELGVDERIEFLVANAHPVNRDASIVAANPLGKVPTLLTDDGHSLYDSRVICEYLDARFGQGRLFPSAAQEGAARWQALTLQALADGLLDAALLVRYEQVARPEELRWPDWQTGQLDKIETSLAALERGELLPLPLDPTRVDIGTLALACALWYLDLRYESLAWRARFPAVARWYGEFSQRPSLQASWAMPS
jgi:glutathione S-transferase